MSASPKLTEDGRRNLDKLLDTVEKRELPALFLTACNANEVIYENQAGWTDFDDQDGKKVDVDTTLHLFSMTKLITSIAVHQLVDQGLADLNDTKLVDKYLPELALDKLEVLEGWDEENDRPILRKAKTGITLAMLLSHSAGLTYSFTCSEAMRKWFKQNPKKDMFAKDATVDDLVQPLDYEPGTNYTYSTSVDWAGFYVERRTGKTLEEYFQENIFKPVGATSMTFYPTEDIMSRLLKPCMMLPDGSYKVLPPRPLGKAATPDEVKLLLGGAGLYGTARDYLKVLQGILRSSPDYTGSSPGLLSEASFKTLFTGVLPAKAVPTLSRFVQWIWYHQPSEPIDDLQQSPGLLIYPNGGLNGRSPGSGCWDGALKTVYWIDPQKGIAAVCDMSIYSESNDNAVGHTIRAFEKTLYAGLETSKSPAQAAM